MKIIKSSSAFMRWRASLSPKKSIGFVPTMGALHAGHFSLVRKSLQQNKITIVSIFVNPIQFKPGEDLKKYPRPWKQDQKALERLGVDVVFIPRPEDIYPRSFATGVEVRHLTKNLCGSAKSRGPAHFKGVTTVVAILFNLTRPQRAYFGQKDFQQLKIIEKMNNDLNFGIKIIGCPIVREPDGLALSSRNSYLSLADRSNAPKLKLALQYGRKLLSSEQEMTLQAIRRRVKSRLAAIPNARLDYVEFVDPQTLQISKKSTRPILLAAAIEFGKTRLIDNILIK